MTQKTIWVLADNRAGNTSQSLGVAESLNAEITVKQIRYTKWVVLPNFLRGSTTIGIQQESVDSLKPPFPDYAVAAGRRAAPLLRWIKKQSGGKTKIIQLMYPGRFGIDDFDVLVLPEHDGCKLKRKNILRTIGAPHRITTNRLAQERQKWTPVFDILPSPKIALIVGGATKDKPFTVAMAAELGQRATDFAKSLGGASFLVTTSRRTGAEQEKMLNSILPEPKFFYGWGNTEMENPYFGYLALADYIIVTGDSVSMCSEACAAEVPVFIYAPAGSVGKKHAKLHQQLYAGGHAQPFESNVSPIAHIRLDAARAVAEFLNQKG